jgi:hypothetical protein
VERLRIRAADFVLVLFLLTALNPAFGGKKAPKLAPTIDLPPSFELDFQFAAKQRVELGPQREVSDDATGLVGTEVFQNLVTTQMISGFGLPYNWTFRLYDSPAINAGSLPDGEVEAYTGIARLLGTDRGLWAAVLSHEVAHVARRHGIRKVLFHEYVEQQVGYWQMRARLGDRGAGWTALAVRIAGNLAEKKLSRDLEHDADMQGMLLMARAGYHPDYAFAMHHLLRMSTSERSRVGTFFLSDHPRWESRDQQTERAYTEALAEYTRLWGTAGTPRGGPPPAVAFLGEVRGMENKVSGTGDLSLPLSCRNVGRPVDLVIRLTKGEGTPVQSVKGDYGDSAGNVVIHTRASCSDTDSARPTIVHIPTSIISPRDRKLKAQVEVRGPGDAVLERSKAFDVHFPKANGKPDVVATRVRVDPEPGEMPSADQSDLYRVASAISPVGIQTPLPNPAAPEDAIRIEQPTPEVAAVPIAIRSEHTNPDLVVTPGTFHTEPGMRSTSPAYESLGILPSALDSSGVLSNWAHPLSRSNPSTWWQASAPVEPSAKMQLSRSAIIFPIQPVDTESRPATFTITNITPGTLRISNITMRGSDSSDFAQTNDCGSSIDAGTTCTVSMIFRPTANGTRTCILTVGGSEREITLAGIGK